MTQHVVDVITGDDGRKHVAMSDADNLKDMQIFSSWAELHVLITELHLAGTLAFGDDSTPMLLLTSKGWSKEQVDAFGVELGRLMKEHPKRLISTPDTDPKL